jgi:hypothetical protein
MHDSGGSGRGIRDLGARWEDKGAADGIAVRLERPGELSIGADRKIGVVHCLHEDRKREKGGRESRKMKMMKI